MFRLLHFIEGERRQTPTQGVGAVKKMSLAVPVLLSHVDLKRGW